ncbi:MAG: putative rane protein [Bacilli bacterium]|nr:putative rane protein [Bacilli bacterium]
MFESGSVITGVISGGWSQLQDTQALSKGDMQKNEYAKHTAKNVTGALGVMAGMEYGAILGSMLLPGVGTFAGTVVGGLMGNRLGRWAGVQAGSLLAEQSRTTHQS